MLPTSGSSPAAPGLPLLVVVEGVHDIHFLKAISTMLHRADAELPDLGQLETERLVLFLPTAVAISRTGCSGSAACTNASFTCTTASKSQRQLSADRSWRWSTSDSRASPC